MATFPAVAASEIKLKRRHACRRRQVSQTKRRKLNRTRRDVDHGEMRRIEIRVRIASRHEVTLHALKGFYEIVCGVPEVRGPPRQVFARRIETCHDKLRLVALAKRSNERRRRRRWWRRRRWRW